MRVNTAVSEMTRERFSEVFGETLRVNESLSRYTSARVGGPAELFLTVNTAQELHQAVDLAYTHKIPYFILGGGSNILALWVETLSKYGIVKYASVQVVNE